MTPLLLLNAVGLTPRLLPMAPRLQALAAAGWMRPLREVTPAVTCTAQATLLTGQTPDRHGIVANGWLWRDSGEVRFWQQSNRLIQATPLYVTARRRAAEAGRTFRCAKLFWWFNQGAAVEVSVTPKPYYGADGNKIFGITGTPAGLTEALERKLGPFPFASFWGPMAGLPCTQWIAHCAAEVLRHERPDLTLVYLPHLDYDPQRFGPKGCDMPRLVGELDAACAPLLDAARAAGVERYIQVSTDEVYGSLGPTGYFTEETPLAPNSPYAASKAASDLLVRSYVHTFHFPALITRCSNNYGPYQFPEKLIPLFISNLLRDEPVPVYGDGQNVRDWIHVRDHCAGILAVWRRGRVGEIYNLGGRSERTNLQLTHALLDALGKPKSLIRYVPDRPGHDRRYAIDCSKSERELGWRPTISFEDGLRQTIDWYRSHADWIAAIRTGEYLKYYQRQYGALMHNKVA